MRFLVLALMIVLLPLRGWAADGMATQMASDQIAIESGSARTHEIRATAAFDHQNQVKPDCHEAITEAAMTDMTANQDHCGTCQACQACHTVALLPTPLEVTANLGSLPLRPARFTFTSVSAALGQKPPIS
jgi:hypothetical protein